MAVRIAGADLAAARRDARGAIMMSLRSAIGVAWGFLAVTVSVGCETSFKARTAPAMIGLERVGERVPEAARASDKQ
jgi:hypothetical protein